MNNSSRKRNIAKGRQYEKLALEYLLDKGYNLIEKNWRAGHKEIDLIMRQGNTVVFVEVKGGLSKDFGHPSERVDKNKIKNLIEAAEQYIISRELTGCDFRFDLITFFEGRLEHYPDAFQRGA